MTIFSETVLEQAAIEWLKDLGYSYNFGPEIAFDGEHPERGDYYETLLIGRLQKAIARINHRLPKQAQEEASRKVMRLGKSSLLLNNHSFHLLLVNGIEIDYKAEDGRITSSSLRMKPIVVQRSARQAAARVCPHQTGFIQETYRAKGQ